MNLCVNPTCPKPDDPANANSPICRHCGAERHLKKRYWVKQLLSDNSGFGTIYEVDDGGVPKILKVLKQNYSKAIELFQKEAEVLDQLNHPGIPKVDLYFTIHPKNRQEPLHCIVMEKVNGQNLAEWMHGKPPISQQLALNWLKQIVNILDRVHAQQYFHRDIKPPNIMLRIPSYLPIQQPGKSKAMGSGELVLIDFGTAREMTHTYLAKVGGAHKITSVNSAGYTPLEQVNGKAVPQSDFYALARTFVFLLTGKHPTQLEEDARSGMLQWRGSVQNIDSLLADLIDEMMAPFPGSRPKNTQEILHRLDKIELKLYPPRSPVVIQPAPVLLPPTPPTPHKSAPVRSLPTTTSKPIKKWLVGGAVVLGMLGLTGVQIYCQSTFNSNPISLLYSLSFLKNTLTGHTYWVSSIAISPDGQTIVSHSSDDTIKVWNLATGTLKATLTGHTSSVSSIAISPDGQTIVSGSDDDTIKVWNLATGTLKATLTGHTNSVFSVAISPDGQTIVSGSEDKTIKVWNLATGTLKATLTGHTYWVSSIAISPDGQTIVSGSFDYTIKVWNLATGTLKATLTGHTDSVRSIAISPDGQTIVSGSEDKTIKVWNLATGTLNATLTGHTDSVRSIAISPDGQTIVSGSFDYTIKVWNLATGTLKATLTGHTDSVNSIAISPDGQTIVSGSYQTIKVWRMPK